MGSEAWAVTQVHQGPQCDKIAENPSLAESPFFLKSFLVIQDLTILKK